MAASSFYEPWAESWVLLLMANQGGVQMCKQTFLFETRDLNMTQER